MQKSWYAVAVALTLLLLATSPLVAQPTTATFNLTGVGSGASLAGVFTSPYTGTINGSSSPIPVICDDFADDSFVPEQWTAYVTSLSTLTSSTDTYLKWGTTGPVTGSDTVNSWSLTQTQAYDAAAVLAIGIISSTGDVTLQQEYSFALWELFDSNSTTGSFAQLNAYGDQAYETGATGGAGTPGAQALLAGAISQATGNPQNLANYLSNYNITIYSYDPANGTSCGGGYCPPPPQEFITVSMTEPPSPALLGLDLLGVAGLLLVVRRRTAKAW